jgi:hypothetical protein
MLALEQLPRFPCRRSDKAPLTKRGFYDARVAVDDRGWPLVGVPGGAASGIDFLDIDPRHGGHLWLAKQRMPVTRVHRTRGGGWHYLFRYAGVRLRREIASGVECKGDGGYVIWWPREGLVVEDHPIAEWPGRFLELARRLDGQNDTPLSPSQQPTLNPEARARSLGNAVLQDPTRKCLHWAACRFSEMVEWGFPQDRAIRLLNFVAAHSGLMKALGPDAVQQNIADGLGIVERRINGLVRTLATAEEGRRETLFWVAAELSRLTPRAEELLIEATTENGLAENPGLAGVQRTIRDAFERGRGKRFTVQTLGDDE